MGLALRLAERGRGQTSPNPMVGAAIVTPDGVVAGLGYHRRAGEPHAEILALRMAGTKARGATLYCTLEPCSHMGRTGPCCVAVAEAGVARVVVATTDPNPLVAGRGLAHLRERGVIVTDGVLGRAAERLNRAFFIVMRAGRPEVILKTATSLDGAVSAAPGQRTPITSGEANRLVHRLRAEVDAIAVGSGTVVSDDPLLTVRGVYRDRPLVRVIFDSRLRMPPAAAMLRTREAGPVVVVTSEEDCATAPGRADALRRAGAELLLAPRHNLPSALRTLAAREIRSILIEGGPTLHAAAWRARVVDRVQVFVAPACLGPGAVRWTMPPDFSLATLVRQRVVPLGPDVLLEGECSPD